MRYRQSFRGITGRDRHAKKLIESKDVLTSNEQQEVIAYFARSLRGSRQFFEVIVCLHAVVAALYICLLLSGTSLIDLSGTSGPLWIPREQQIFAEPAAVEPTPAARDARHHRTSPAVLGLSGKAMATFSFITMLYNLALLLWAAWSCYKACRLLRIDVEDLRETEIGEQHSRHPEGSLSPVITATKQQRTLENLHRRTRADPVFALYVAAALSSLSSLFYLGAMVYRQRATRSAYTYLRLQPPQAMSLHIIAGAALEYTLAGWQPLFHLGVALLVRSLLNTREQLIALSRLKYAFDKV